MAEQDRLEIPVPTDVHTQARMDSLKTRRTADFVALSIVTGVAAGGVALTLAALGPIIVFSFAVVEAGGVLVAGLDIWKAQTEINKLRRG